MSANPAKTMARGASNNRALQTLARVGFGVNGLIHALIGAIAIGIAFGGSENADQSGAFAQLAEAPGGVFVLWTVVVGLAALGLWLSIGAFLFPARDPKRRVAHVVVELGKGLAYLLLSGTALVFARGGSTNASSDTGTASADLLAMPGGVLVVLLIGVVVFAIGAYFAVKGITQRFAQDISVPPALAGRATIFAGVVGYAAKGVALAVVGVLFAVAALTVDPAQATGLDGALKALSALPFGAVIIGVIGCGLIAYGGYCVVRAFRARL